MRFKQYFLLKENPDVMTIYYNPDKIPEFEYSEFSELINNRIDYTNINGLKVFNVSFSERDFNPFTFMYRDGYFIYGSTMDYYHGHIIDIAKGATNTTNDQKDFLKYLEENRIYFYGDFSENHYKDLLEDLKYKTIFDFRATRSPYLLGRCWDLTNGITAVSLWKQKNSTVHVLNEVIRKDLSLFLKHVYPEAIQSKILYDINESDAETPFLNGEIKASEKPISANNDEIPIHQLPPERKRSALLKMGVKPKTPKGFQNRREGD